MEIFGEQQGVGMITKLGWHLLVNAAYLDLFSVIRLSIYNEKE